MMKTLTLTYKLIPEEKGFSVVCLDWDCAYTQGETIEECRQNAIEVTELLLESFLNNELQKKQLPKIVRRFASPRTFQLSFDIATGTYIDLQRIPSKTILKRISNLASLL